MCYYFSRMAVRGAFPPGNRCVFHSAGVVGLCRRDQNPGQGGPHIRPPQKSRAQRADHQGSFGDEMVPPGSTLRRSLGEDSDALARVRASAEPDERARDEFLPPGTSQSRLVPPCPGRVVRRAPFDGDPGAEGALRFHIGRKADRPTCTASQTLGG